jgi:hypothetical protein
MFFWYTILKHTYLTPSYRRSTLYAYRHQNVLRYGPNIKHYIQTPNIGQPYVGVDTPTRSLTCRVAATVSCFLSARLSHLFYAGLALVAVAYKKQKTLVSFDPGSDVDVLLLVYSDPP